MLSATISMNCVNTLKHANLYSHMCNNNTTFSPHAMEKSTQEMLQVKVLVFYDTVCSNLNDESYLLHSLGTTLC